MGIFHTRPLPLCRGVGYMTCGKLAVVEIFNNRNARYGHYCKDCGDKQLKVLEETYAGTKLDEMPRT